MSDNYIIEIRPKGLGVSVQAGIVVRDGDRFRFFAATHAFNALDGQLFKNPTDAKKAAARHVADAARPPFVPFVGLAAPILNAAALPSGSQDSP